MYVNKCQQIRTQIYDVYSVENTFDQKEQKRFCGIMFITLSTENNINSMNQSAKLLCYPQQSTYMYEA